MTSAVVTYSDVNDDPGMQINQARYHYTRVAEYSHYTVDIPKALPRSLRVSLEVGQEPDGVWVHIAELDVTAEGEKIDDALRNVYAAACAWLTYIRDESPNLAGDLAGQERYVELLDQPLFRWFKSIHSAQ